MSADDVDPIDKAMSEALTDMAEEFLAEVEMVAERIGTEVNLAQVIGILLGIGSLQEEITREDWMEVWGLYETYVLPAVRAARGELKPGSPADVANAKDSREAARMTDYWGPRVTNAAFSFVTTHHEEHP